MLKTKQHLPRGKGQSTHIQELFLSCYYHSSLLLVDKARQQDALQSTAISRILKKLPLFSHAIIDIYIECEEVL